MRTATTVFPKVNNEHVHGLLARVRRHPRRPGILSAGGAFGAKGSFGRLSRSPVGVFQPLDTDSVGDGILSAFRRSNVSECLFTSNLAEVKLRLLSSWWLGGPSAGKASVDSSSSEEDFVRIELGGGLHSEGKRSEKESSRG